MQRSLVSLIAVPAILFLFFTAGCERRQQPAEEASAIQAVEYDSVLVVLLDMSGSYGEQLEKRAFPFFGKAADNFFRDRLGSGNDRIIIAQISGGVTKSLLWDGSPRAFRHEFGGGTAFKKYLREKSDQNGSRVHGGINDSLRYLLALPGVKDKKTKTALLLFTDMEDNHPDGDKDKVELLKLLSEYGQTRGCLGMYWVDTRFLAEWQSNLRASGIKNYAIHSEIVADPPLPSWSE